jgi:predicted RNase H-like HicB family nuclease
LTKGKKLKREEIDLVFWLLYTSRQGGGGMEQTFEATIEKRDKWYIGWVDVVPGAFSQGRTIKEVEENLKEAVQLILESQRQLDISFPKTGA